MGAVHGREKGDRPVGLPSGRGWEPPLPSPAGPAASCSGQSLWLGTQGLSSARGERAAQEWEPASNRPRSKERSVCETGAGTERDLEAKEGTLPTRVDQADAQGQQRVWLPRHLSRVKGAVAGGEG